MLHPITPAEFSRRISQLINTFIFIGSWDMGARDYTGALKSPLNPNVTAAGATSSMDLTLEIKDRLVRYGFSDVTERGMSVLDVGHEKEIAHTAGKVGACLGLDSTCRRRKVTITRRERF